MIIVTGARGVIVRLARIRGCEIVRFTIHEEQDEWHTMQGHKHMQTMTALVADRSKTALSFWSSVEGVYDVSVPTIYQL